VSQWVGAPLPRKEDRRMLLGRSRFVADLDPRTPKTRTPGPGLLHAAFVRSPHAHARVAGLDAAAAIKQPGVSAVFTSASLGDPYLLAMLEREEFIPTRMPVLAGDVTRFVGEPVALVVADDPYRAEDAAELVEVDWDPRPAVMSIEAATAPGAPRLAPAAVLGAINDALSDTDVRFDHIPVLPQDLCAALSSADLSGADLSGADLSGAGVTP
jgi:aerobic carbon-monoxide dehydrogenase large subunit